MLPHDLSSDADHDAILFDGLRVALHEVRQLGYVVERMDVRIAIDNGTCRVRFARLPKPGFVSVGGGVAVDVDTQTGRVLSMQREQ